MLHIVDKVLSILFPVMTMHHADMRKMGFAGKASEHRQWHRKREIQWFNGFPGWPKLPLVQRLRASPSALDPVVSSQSEEAEGEEPEEDPEPLR